MKIKFITYEWYIYKTQFFPRAAVVSILLYGCTTWILTKRKLHKNATSYIEQILEATSNKTAAVRPPTTHLENHPNKTSKHAGLCRRNKDKLISNVLQLIPSHGRENVGRSFRTYLRQLCMEIEDLLEAMDNRVEWRERERERERES